MYEEAIERFRKEFPLWEGDDEWTVNVQDRCMVKPSQVEQFLIAELQAQKEAMCKDCPFCNQLMVKPQPL